MDGAVLLTWSARLNDAPDVAWQRFLAELWIGGGGFGPAPTIVDRGTPDGIGCTRRIDVGVASLLERIEAGERPSWLRYRVVNPGWTTFPVKQHSGEVRMAPASGGDGTDLTWQVSMEPLPGMRPFVVLMTRLVIGRYLDRLRSASHRPSEP